MSAHFQSSGPRSNAYSESKFTNWTAYDPFFAEARAAFKQFDGRISQVPKFPHVIVLRPQIPDFIHACKRLEVIARLQRIPPTSRQGLRAVFVLAGTRKQESSWRSKLGCYGMLELLCFSLRPSIPASRPLYTLDDLRRFYIEDVLVHEVAHHLDRERIVDTKAKEAFAHDIVQENLRK